MDTQTALLAERFSACTKMLTAIGDETRQHLILEMMRLGRCSGVRVCEITERTNLSHPTYIGQLERGEKNAILESIKKISSALGVPLSKLLEKLGEGSSDESIPLKCYEFLSTKSVDDQEHLYAKGKESRCGVAAPQRPRESVHLSSIL